MGFTLYQGPEIDDDQHVFTMLNFAADHPARDMQDTFFIERSSTMDVTKNVLLRSHTSNDEAHYMSTHEPPIRVLCQVVYTVMRLSRLVHTASSIR